MNGISQKKAKRKRWHIKETNVFQIEKGQDIKQEVLQRYKTILPDELIKIWEDNGLATLIGGYLKVVNPEDYQELLKETYFRGNISVPILVQRKLNSYYIY